MSMTTKPQQPSQQQEVTYTTAQWNILKGLRQKAAPIMTALDTFHLQSVVHGSLARGDVHQEKRH
jgi:predicted nucleotidyltransferase